jgi:hypothetical protein
MNTAPFFLKKREKKIKERNRYKEEGQRLLLLQTIPANPWLTIIDLDFPLTKQIQVDQLAIAC